MNERTAVTIDKPIRRVTAPSTGIVQALLRTLHLDSSHGHVSGRLVLMSCRSTCTSPTSTVTVDRPRPDSHADLIQTPSPGLTTSTEPRQRTLARYCPANASSRLYCCTTACVVRSAPKKVSGSPVQGARPSEFRFSFASVQHGEGERHANITSHVGQEASVTTKTCLCLPSYLVTVRVCCPRVSVSVTWFLLVTKVFDSGFLFFLAVDSSALLVPSSPQTGDLPGMESEKLLEEISQGRGTRTPG